MSGHACSTIILLVLFIAKLHPKNQSEIRIHSINIYDQRILKSDWPRTCQGQGCYNLIFSACLFYQLLCNKLIQMPVYSRDTEDQRILKSEGLRACRGHSCSKLRGSVCFINVYLHPKNQSQTPNY